MFTLIKKYKREFVYTSYLFLVLELLITPKFIVSIEYFALTAIIGYILINIWLINTFKLHAFHKVSKYSESLLKVNVVERLFTYVVLPLLFYSSICVFLLFSPSSYLNQTVIVISLTLFFYLFLYVRTSYEKVFSINKMTRFVYDFISVAVFFLTTSVVTRLGLNDIWSGVSIFAISLFSLVYMLSHHRKVELFSLLISIVCSIVLGVSLLLMGELGFMLKASIISIMYYLIVSVWNLRFSGTRNISDYIPPLMFSIMALILILSL